MNKFDVIVVGGGAAGMLCAATAAKQGHSVLLLERNEKPCRKVMITGKGRCNVTNFCDTQDFLQAVRTNPRFLYSAMDAFSTYDTYAFFEELGVPLKVERGNRVFPVSDKAADIVDALVRCAKDRGVKLAQSRVTELLLEQGKVQGVRCEDGVCYTAPKVVIATGGKSYPLTGSTGDGYLLAQQAGHSIAPPHSSLIPILIQEKWCSNLMGLSLKNVTLTVREGKKEVYSALGEMLFTHFGLSGPLVLSASAHMEWKKMNKYSIHIDLKPGLAHEKLDQRLLRDFEENKNKDFINSLSALLPKKLIPVAVKLSGIEGTTKINQITKEQRFAFVSLLKDLTLTPTGFRPVEEAIITSGGVAVAEVNPKNMESKKVAGLFFAGEVLDVDAYTGGYNMQIAFSTGYLAGMSES